MSQIVSIPSAASIEANRTWWAAALARYTSNRREQLGLTVARAAELSGLELSEWLALEDGWVPRDMAMICTIAQTLQVRTSDYNFLVFLARCHQECR